MVSVPASSSVIKMGLKSMLQNRHTYYSMVWPLQRDKSLTREERDTKSFGGSGSSGGRSESQESEAGVRGLGLQGFGL